MIQMLSIVSNASIKSWIFEWWMHDWTPHFLVLIKAYICHLWKGRKIKYEEKIEGNSNVVKLFIIKLQKTFSCC